MVTCPFLAFSAVDRGQHGPPDWSVAMQPHTHQTVLHCVFWHLSIRTSNLSNSSSSVWLDHAGQPSLPTCINEPWAITLSLVHHCSFFGPLFIDTDHALGTPHRAALWEMLWASHLAITTSPLSNWLKSLRTPIFPASNTSTMRTTCSTGCLIYPTHLQVPWWRDNQCYSVSGYTVLPNHCMKPTDTGYFSIYPSIVCTRFVPFMESQGFWLEPIPAVSGQGQGSTWTSRQLITGLSLMAESDMQGVNFTSGGIWGSVSCSRTLRHTAQLSSAQSTDKNTW